MTDFLIKSTLCLIVLLAVYHLFLEKEKMHVFNRFYLLFCVIFSLIIPFVTIEVFSETVAPTIEVNNIQVLQGSTLILEESTDYLSIILWSFYGLVTFLLAIRFMRNILKITSSIKSNTVIRYKNASLVLLNEKTLPHTFLNAIFINEKDYHNRDIEEELYTHEITHVNQRHTLDILFIEIVKTVFWFNPIFILYKKAIQLNHEFLADEKVVKSYNDVPFYQNLLLAKANKNNTFYLASNLNYSVTKKRLIMMTKTTSTSRTMLKKIALIPLVYGLIFFLCIETVAQEKATTVESQKNKEITKDQYFTGVRFIVYEGGFTTKKHEVKKGKIKLNKLYEELTDSEKEELKAQLILAYPGHLTKKFPTKKEIEEFKNSKKYAIWINGKNVPNKTLENYKLEDIVYFGGSVIKKNARTKTHPQPFQYNFYTSEYFDENKMGEVPKKYPGDTIEITSMDKPIGKTKKASSKITKKVQTLTTSQETTQPNFPGGMEAFYKYVGGNFKTPKEFKGKGKVYAKFVVEKDGSLSEIEILRGLGFGVDEEVIRVLKESPKWIPGKEDDKPVRVQYYLPFSIIEKS